MGLEGDKCRKRVRSTVASMPIAEGAVPRHRQPGCPGGKRKCTLRGNSWVTLHGDKRPQICPDSKAAMGTGQQDQHGYLKGRNVEFQNHQETW